MELPFALLYSSLLYECITACVATCCWCGLGSHLLCVFCVCAAMMNDGAGRLRAHPGVERCARISVMYVGLSGNAAS